MPNPITWLWKEVRGNALWDATKWLWAAGGTAVSTGMQSAYAYIYGHPNSVSLMIGLAAVLFFGVVALVINKTEGSAPLEMKTMGESSTKSSLEAFAQLQLADGDISPQQNFSLEILEGFLGTAKLVNSGFPFGPEIYLLLRIRVTNRIDIPLTVKSWAVSFHPCHDEYAYGGDGKIADIPAGFSYTPTDLWGNNIGTGQLVGPRIVGNCLDSPLRRGKHEDGFLLVAMYSLSEGLFDYVRRSVEIKVLDAEDGISSICVRPGAWLKPAVFAQESAMPPSLLPPRIEPRFPG